MRALTRPGLVLAIAVAVFALPTLASGALSGPAANQTTYEDSVGEDPAGPDITSIVTSNDDAGTITFKINIPNRPSYTRDILALLFIDSDAKQDTGDPDSFGADHVIQLALGEIILFRWDGTDYTVSATQSSLSYRWSGGPTIKINAADIANTRRFAFDAQVISGVVFDDATGAIDFTNAKSDIAPAVGLYPYEVKITPPTLVVKKFSTVPGKPAAGKAFTMRLVTARSDTGAVVQNGRVTCIGRLGNARLKAQLARVVAGAATCTWSIPANAKGKTFRGSATIAFEGLKASQGFMGKVR